MQLTNPFSKTQVNLAGKALARIELATGDGLLAKIVGGLLAIAVVESWRASHVSPLARVSTILHKNAKSFDPTATVSRRLKRMESIIAKLQRQPKMQLTTMQDKGGCRAILNSIEQVSALKAHYKSTLQTSLEEPREYDYISNPKEDGYRSSHLVVRFRNCRIEVQIRTRLQHEWATAVEAVDLFLNQALKTGGGNIQWRRFFALVGSLFAAKESCVLVPNTPHTHSELVAETYDLWLSLQVDKLLTSWITAMKMMESPEMSAQALPANSMFLVELDVEEKTTSITPFRADQLSEARAAYAKKEEENAMTSQRSAVLVSVDSVDEP